MLKGLQTCGHSHSVLGENLISFCNVIFFAQLAVGLTALLPGRRDRVRTLPTLTPDDRRLLVTHAVLGRFLGTVAYYQALQSLSVISQTLCSPWCCQGRPCWPAGCCGNPCHGRSGSAWR